MTNHGLGSPCRNLGYACIGNVVKLSEHVFCYHVLRITLSCQNTSSNMQNVTQKVTVFYFTSRNSLQVLRVTNSDQRQSQTAVSSNSIFLQDRHQSYSHLLSGNLILCPKQKGTKIASVRCCVLLSSYNKDKSVYFRLQPCRKV